MKTMREYAYEYEMKHKNKGMVVALEDYRFLFAEKPKMKMVNQIHTGSCSHGF